MKKIIFFKSQNEFRNWLLAHHLIETELFVGFYKLKYKKETVTWSESVDQAICFGWIDGVRKSIDDNSYCIRFTPRRPNSIWSNINIKKVKDLMEKNLMTKNGILVYESRMIAKSGIYSHENEPIPLNNEFENLFKENIEAWRFFSKQTPSYKKGMIFWIMSAKQEKTKLNRLNKLILESNNGNKII